MGGGAGHYGGAWYRQKLDFDAWPGSILITTNCVLDPPPESYAENLFTTGAAHSQLTECECICWGGSEWSRVAPSGKVAALLLADLGC